MPVESGDRRRAAGVKTGAYRVPAKKQGNIDWGGSREEWIVALWLGVAAGSEARLTDPCACAISTAETRRTQRPFGDSWDDRGTKTT